MNPFSFSNCSASHAAHSLAARNGQITEFVLWYEIMSWLASVTSELNEAMIVNAVTFLSNSTGGKDTDEDSEEELHLE